MATNLATSLPRAAIAVERTEDRKLTTDYRHRPVSATHVAQQTCPATCSLRGHGCYTEHGPENLIRLRLNGAASNVDPVDVAWEEATAIDGLSGRGPLRLHVVGDCPADASATIVAGAAMRYEERSGEPPWTYTHAWADVQRASWGTVSVLASCETEDDVTRATERGYATAAVFPADAPLPREFGGLRVLPCPQQTGAKPDCESCRVCTKADRLVGKIVIGFRAHGSTRLVAGALATRKEG